MMGPGRTKVSKHGPYICIFQTIWRAPVGPDSANIFFETIRTFGRTRTILLNMRVLRQRYNNPFDQVKRPISNQW